MFHGSPPNTWAHARLAINQAMCPAEVPSIHYVVSAPTEVTAFEVDDDFYCRVMIDDEKTEGKKVLTFEKPSRSIEQYQVNLLVIHD